MILALRRKPAQAHTTTWLFYGKKEVKSYEIEDGTQVYNAIKELFQTTNTCVHECVFTTCKSPMSDAELGEICTAFNCYFDMEQYFFVVAPIDSP